MFGRDLHDLLNENGGRLLMAHFEKAYLRKFGVACSPASMGYASLNNLFYALPEFVYLKGRGQYRTLYLSRDFAREL
jgi:hypothetical protein